MKESYSERLAIYTERCRTERCRTDEVTPSSETCRSAGGTIRRFSKAARLRLSEMLIEDSTVTFRGIGEEAQFADDRVVGAGQGTKITVVDLLSGVVL
jgi:hypothetical protein